MPGRNRVAEKIRLAKHVVAAGSFVRDAGSTPAASSLRSSARENEDCRAEARFWGGGGPFCAEDEALELRLGKPVESEMEFTYVYILQSVSDEQRFYTGLTDNLKDRLRRHNGGEVPHTLKFRPWRIKVAIAFRDRARAIDFEQYLKTSSGRAFAKKRL